jgi:hypothetical protein
MRMRSGAFLVMAMTNVHIRHIQDAAGDLVDLEYYCHTCGIQHRVPGWPAPEAIDYPVFCSDCGLLLDVPLTLDGQIEFQEWKENI